MESVDIFDNIHGKGLDIGHNGDYSFDNNNVIKLNIYPGENLDIVADAESMPFDDGIFDKIRIKGHEITGLPEDKWNPGDVYLKLFGVNIKTKNGFLPLEIQGSQFLRPAKITEKLGSAQVKSCAIFGGLNTPGTTFIKAKKSRNHTESLLKYLKYPIIVKSKGAYDYIKLKGLNHLKAFNYEVPGDISSAAFFIVLTLLSKNSKILIKKVNVNKTRIGVIKILNKMNAKIQIKNKRLYKGEETADIYVKSKNNLKSIHCPKKLNSFAIDEFLVIFLAASKAKGISSFKDLDELNKKESPRLDIAVKFLKMIGIKVIRRKNNIQIYGNPELSLKGNFYVKNFFKDHRVFMMSCIAALSFGGSWQITDKNSINTSFPSFLKIIKFLGGKYEVK